MAKKVLMATCALIPMSTSIALASDGTVGTITASSLNVRSGPSTSNNVLFTVKKGEVVDILETSNGWYKIRNSNNQYGWASSKYIELTAKENSDFKKVVNITALNMRSGPSSSYRVIKVLKLNDEVEVLSESKGWSKIKYDGRLGYVATKYLTLKQNNNDVVATPDNSQTVDTSDDIQNDNNQNDSQEYLNIEKQVTASVLNVRQGPTTKDYILGKLKKGDVVTVLSENNNWAKIKYNGTEGFVSCSYLKTINSEPIIKPEINPPVEENVSGYNINYNNLDYTLQQHVEAQHKRNSVGGNMIHSSINVGDIQLASVTRCSFENENLVSTTNDEIYAVETASLTEKTARSGGFIVASKNQIEYYLNPSNFTKSDQGMMQFLRIDKYKEGITESELNSYLNSLPNASNGKNVFYNKASAFLTSAKKYNIDVTYLVSHAMWETGYGTSALAKGQTISTYKGKKITPTTVYNFFGIGAIDKSANVSGAEAAYSNGWTSVEKAIDGAAKWISENYIHNEKFNQNTLYKMRFNYDQTWHQYATDVNWANGISKIMLNMVHFYDNASNLSFEIPKYK